MAVFVVDASAALAWCFEDEASSFTDGLLDRLRHGDQIVVPAHWPTEISNGLLVALRRGRIKAGQSVLQFAVCRLATKNDGSARAQQRLASLIWVSTRRL